MSWGCIQLRAREGIAFFAEATVEELVGMIERGELRLPEMQRRYVWRSTRFAKGSSQALMHFPKKQSTATQSYASRNSSPAQFHSAAACFSGRSAALR
jgi:hypothetical protein